VEEGERFSSFGQARFNDFVIIEGSTNQEDWIPLVDGYDSRQHEDWSEAYANGEDGRSMLFNRRNINLLDTFEAGEIVQIRFRLFSDNRVNAWGWAIDDLSIQAGEVVGLRDDQYLLSNITLYPNPTSGILNLTIENVLRGDINMRVIDFAGKQFMNQSLSNQTGLLEQRLNLAELPFGIYVIELNNGQDIVTKKILKF
ncbi:MAG: T9SS type A sorting domain-containing protein, partial [Bacteroidota bacterium]